MGKFAKELIESMQQAAKHAAGKKLHGVRVSKVESPDVKAIRLSLRVVEAESK
jgi:putative transcriptional regulator